VRSADQQEDRFEYPVSFPTPRAGQAFAKKHGIMEQPPLSVGELRAGDELFSLRATNFFLSGSLCEPVESYTDPHDPPP